MTWRRGRRLGRTIFCDDRLVGMMDDVELAAKVELAQKKEAA